ncbi:unnamed protein product [Spirodela intermedia]|uniref:Uncharacterized protein n=1 Tax=Spirodela intermedia TaxID=51605 RepID=A0A7I8KBX4_SPIIN|nr:unnamed protein product [Spirodela intermedia]
MEKTPDEIYNLYENLSENSRDQASFELYDMDKKRGPASGSEVQSGSSCEQGLERLELMGARVCHSPSTSPVASRLFAIKGSRIPRVNHLRLINEQAVVGKRMIR